MKPFVVAIVATWRRPRELQRLLDSLTANAPEVRAVVVADNGSSPEIKAPVEEWSGEGIYVDPGANLGCGGGLRVAGEKAWELFRDKLTHLAVVDDDAVLKEGAMGKILHGMEAAGAQAGCAMVVNGQGKVAWVPGLIGRRSGKIEKQGLTPEEYVEQYGSEPVSFTWAQGVCLVTTRELTAKAGFHETNFWVRGEDLEYSLRLTAQSRGVWVPGALVQHLPPDQGPTGNLEGEYLKHRAMLQNVAYIAFRLPHGHRILWSLPSNIVRFVRTWGIPSTRHAIRALWRGAALRLPAGEGT